MEPEVVDYSSWSSQKLIDRVTALEEQLRQLNSIHASSTRKSSPKLPPKRKNPRSARPFEASRYSTRLIALKFGYLGQRYNGFEHHANNKTPLRTIEDVLWQALWKAHLIFPTGSSSKGADEVNWEGCEYSKCGRTDRGVSAFGQVIGIRVRSNRPLGKPVGSDNSNPCPGEEIELAALPLTNRPGGYRSPQGTDRVAEECFAFDPIKDELPYVQILNRLLPPDIRALAWCPSPPVDFSARFSCGERQYRYFFTQPGFVPTVSQGASRRGATPLPEGWLDIEAMKQAAKMFEGSHDFRNFCKWDPSKQIDVFVRDIFSADIVRIEAEDEPASFLSRPPFARIDGHQPPLQPLKPKTPATFVFILHGSGFLWHQVRHMMAILFLVGQGLEPPSIVAQLLDTTLIPTKPMYEMADDAPLVLWDCIFPRQGKDRHTDALEWVYGGEGDDDSSARDRGSDLLVPGSSKFEFGGVVDNLWTEWRRRKMDEILAGMLLNVAAKDHSMEKSPPPTGALVGFERRQQLARLPSQKIFGGGNTSRLAGRYVPLLERRRLEPVEVVNRRYAERKGFGMKERRAKVEKEVEGKEEKEEEKREEKAEEREEKEVEQKEE